mmetsp:Transcript_91370/g.293455  ORF Transcript_91370/g.293455 Transcript_91370/m.293455 type:complete len:109 (-) Transcript_91370:122-448(-)
MVDIWFDVSSHPGEVLVNYTKVDLGSYKPAWSPSPLAYTDGGCWSEGNGVYTEQGFFAAAVLGGSSSLLLVALAVWLVKMTLGSCCGTPLKVEPAQEAPQVEELGNVP